MVDATTDSGWDFSEVPAARLVQRAAAQMLKRAEVAPRGPWTADWDSCDCGGGYPCGHGDFITSISFPDPITQPSPGQEVRWYHHQASVEIPTEAMEQMLGFQPAIATEVAGLLDRIAGAWTDVPGSVRTRAHRLANAYLQNDPDEEAQAKAFEDAMAQVEAQER